MGLLNLAMHINPKTKNSYLHETEISFPCLLCRNMLFHFLFVSAKTFSFPFLFCKILFMSYFHFVFVHKSEKVSAPFSCLHMMKTAFGLRIY
jgi:hypothetical protein